MKRHTRIIVKSVNWVGDAVMVTPALGVLRRGFPDARITLLARPSVADVFLANPDVDDLWVADERGGMGPFLKLAGRIRRGRFDLGIALTNSFGSALLLRLGGVKRRVGYDRDGRRLLLTDPVPVTPESLAGHEVEYYIRLLGGLCPIGVPPRQLVVPPTPEAEAEARVVIQRYKLESDGAPLVGLCPGAAYGTAKRWAPERYAQVAEHLVKHWGARVAIVGAPSERDVAQEIVRESRVPVAALSGEFPLRVLIALLGRMRLFVTNDCGAMHLAAARDVPIVAIFGPTKSENTGPYHPRAHIVRANELACPDHPCMRHDCPREHACMANVSVRDVTHAVDAQMQESALLDRVTPDGKNKG